IDACGYHALLILANLLAPDVRATLVRYETSGANARSYDSSVSYVAAAFAGPHAPANAREALPRSEMKALLGVAIRALKRAVRAGAEVDPATARGDLRDGGRLGDAAGSFVTLKKRGELRGCIGTLAATRPMWQSVAANAMAAALRDDRFPTV